MSKTILITNCCISKKEAAKVSLQDMPNNITHNEAMKWWVSRLQKYVPNITPQEQYTGVAFNTLSRIQEWIKPEDIYIVTGGQGLINLVTDKIVPYDFTSDKNIADNIKQKIVGPFSPTRWWSEINTKLSRKTSISTLLEDPQVGKVIISCTKGFLKYILEELMGSKNLNKLYIMFPKGSVTSINKGIRNRVLPYSRDYIEAISCNRNNMNHAAALVFISSISEGEDAEEILLRQQQFKIETKNRAASLEEIKHLEPELMQKIEHKTISIVDAYNYVRNKYGAIGGRIAFRGFYRVNSKEEALKISEKDIKNSSSAFSSLELPSAGTKSNSGDTEFIAGLSIFISGFKEVALPGQGFKSSTIVDWAQNFYDDVPTYMTSSKKIAITLAANAEYLGIESSGSGIYIIKKENK